MLAFLVGGVIDFSERDGPSPSPRELQYHLPLTAEDQWYHSVLSVSTAPDISGSFDSTVCTWHTRRNHYGKVSISKSLVLQCSYLVILYYMHI